MTARDQGLPVCKNMGKMLNDQISPLAGGDQQEIEQQQDREQFPESRVSYHGFRIDAKMVYFPPNWQATTHLVSR